MNMTWDSEDSFWKRTIVYSAAAAVVVIGGGAFYYFKFMKGHGPEVTQAPVAAAPSAPEAPAEPEHHPLPGAADASAKPLPPLNSSDAAITADLSGVFGKKSIDQMLVPEQVVRHIVVTVDNLPRTKVAEQMRPLKATPGQTVTVANGDTITLSGDNSARYAAFIKLVQNTDTQTLGALYLRYYPLFQQSYEDLGYPGQYFNDRLVQVIDHLLQTPDVRGPIELKQGRVFYEFADAGLESRSAGQKLLLRMGSDNAAVLKKKLRELRTFVTTSQDPPDQPASTGADAAKPGSAAAPATPATSPDMPKVEALPNDEATPAPTPR